MFILYFNYVFYGLWRLIYLYFEFAVMSTFVACFDNLWCLALKKMRLINNILSIILSIIVRFSVCIRKLWYHIFLWLFSIWVSKVCIKKAHSILSLGLYFIKFRVVSLSALMYHCILSLFSKSHNLAIWYLYF